MSLNNPITVLKKGGLQSPDIGQTILGNIPSLVTISPRSYFLQQMESWISAPSNASQWIILFEDFPKTLQTEVLQGLEYTSGDKKGWNIPKKALTNYALQKTIGCVFAQGVRLPKERNIIGYTPPIRGFLGGPVAQGREPAQPLILDFLETYLSFVDGILRPWTILSEHRGLVARPKAESIKTNITVIQYGFTSQNLAPIARKIWNFYDVCPVGITSATYDYSNGEVERRTGIEFAYNKYDLYNTTYIPVFDLIDKFSNGGVKEILNTVILDESINKIKNIF